MFSLMTLDVAISGRLSWLTSPRYAMTFISTLLKTKPAPKPHLRSPRRHMPSEP